MSKDALELVAGVDIGLTGMKVVAFDLKGNIVASASAPSPQNLPKPYWIERDGHDYWDAFGGMCRDLNAQIAGLGGKVLSIGISAHGDGAWLIDDEFNPTRPGILSLDSRAIDTAAKLMDEHKDDLIRVTGQGVVPASTGAVLKWIADNEPEAIDKASWFVAAKDFLRIWLTGEVGTDLTEASTAFCNVRTQDYDDEAFSIYGLDVLRDKAPQIDACTKVVGTVIELASKHTGFPVGTPVVAGCHDVDAGAIGAGAVLPGHLAVMAGTWSINEVITDKPTVGDGWLARSFVEKGLWMNMSISPASSANLEWFINTLCAAEADAARRDGRSPYAFVDEEVSQVKDDDQPAFFVPFLYGNPMGIDASAVFSGLRAWHTRGNILRAIYEGIAFTHKIHCDWLIDAMDVTEVRVVGGVSNSKIWPQYFADCLNKPILIPEVREGGALGTAMLAAVGAGAFSDLAAAAEAMGSSTRQIDPTQKGVELMASRYEAFTQQVDLQKPWWAANK
jgi:L-xylulokinase